MKRITTPIALAALLSLAPLTWASDSAKPAAGQAVDDAYCTEDTPACRKVGSWDVSLALGIGTRTNPVIGRDDQTLILLPQFSWYGEKFFVENYELGYTLLDTPRQMLNLIGTMDLDAFFFRDSLSIGNFTLEGGQDLVNDGSSIPGNGQDGGDNTDTDAETAVSTGTQVDPKSLDKRRTAALAGIEYSHYLGNWMLNAQLLSDISGVHNGQELRLGASYDFAIEKNHFSVFGGLEWQSRALLDYYYGTNSNEVNNASLLFEAKADTATVVKFAWHRQLSKAWSLSASVRYKRFGSSTSDSPLLEDNKVITAFIGGVYHF